MDDATRLILTIGVASAPFCVAAASFWISWLNRRTQIRSLDFTNCLEVVKQLGEAQRRVFSKKEDIDAARFEFFELLNLLEALALMINERRTHPSTTRFTSKFLIEALAWIRVDPTLKEQMAAAITSDDTFSELKQFEKRQAEIIRRTSRHFWLKRH
jgi:hypothetical protein